MVEHENSAKRNFDYFTGQNSAQKFYQGRLNEKVEEKARTWKKDQSLITQFRYGYKPRAQSSSSRADQLSNAFVEVANDRKSNIQAAKRMPFGISANPVDFDNGEKDSHYRKLAGGAEERIQS